MLTFSSEHIEQGHLLNSGIENKIWAWNQTWTEIATTGIETLSEKVALSLNKRAGTEK